ncbi:MAG: lysozyme [Candidatus Deianiraeaceae bacterium]
MNGFDDPQNVVISKEKAEELILHNAKEYYDCVVEKVGDVCNSNQIISLTSLCFNIGVNAFCRSTLLKVAKKNPHNFPEIEKQFMRWIYADGSVNMGLRKRREEEVKIYREL